MVRKHARRAVKAAFALALAIPIVLGGTANAQTTATPTITVGTKNFTEAFVLGQLYKQALEAKGFKVAYKENIGSSELIDTALTSGKINFYPEYTGVLALNIAGVKPAPKTAAATYAAAKAFEEKRGYTMLRQTPFFDADSFTVLTSTARKYGLKTISDLKKVPNLSYGGYPECDKRITCLLGLKQIYGLKNIKFVQLGTIPVTKLIDSGKVTGGDIFTTEPALANPKYTALIDNKHIFGFQNVAPIVSKKIVAAYGAKFTNAVNAVSAKLTNAAMIAMNKAVAVDKKTPAAVAGAFLKANGLA
ncbi:MAG TPA: ABC transporter substrate-binding protein [Gaiellaceae bacterium]|nr:ABC transporter substrate-binding protein [Gaiellaceae bacterium]